MAPPDLSTIEAFRGRHFFLSNFYEVTFTVPGLGAVPTSEHAFNALKSADPAEQREVLAASTPAEAKRRGRTVALRPDWDAGWRVRAMQVILAHKFGSREMRQRLLSTGSAILVEGNNFHDNFWGDCRCGERRCAGRGVNMLGELLMAERAKDGKLR